MCQYYYRLLAFKSVNWRVRNEDRRVANFFGARPRALFCSAVYILWDLLRKDHGGHYTSAYVAEELVNYSRRNSAKSLIEVSEGQVSRTVPTWNICCSALLKNRDRTWWLSTFVVHRLRLNSWLLCFLHYRKAVPRKLIKGSEVFTTTPSSRDG